MLLLLTGLAMPPLAMLGAPIVTPLRLCATGIAGGGGTGP